MAGCFRGKGGQGAIKIVPHLPVLQCSHLTLLCTPMPRLESFGSRSHLCIDRSVLDPLSSINNVVICRVYSL